MAEFESIEQAAELFTSLANELKAEKFLVYTAEQQQQICAAKEYLAEKCKEAFHSGDEETGGKIFGILNSPTILSGEEKQQAANLYDVKGNLKKLFDNMGNNTDLSLDTELFTSSLQRESAYEYSMYSLLSSPKIMQGKEAEQAQCRKILGKMIEGSTITKSPNKELAKLVEKGGGLDKVQFNILDENGVDGHASFSQKRMDNGGSGIVIDINRGAFENNFKGLAMLIGHELGHCLDYSQRPEGCPIVEKYPEEYWADLAGNQLVSNGNFSEREKFEAKMAFMIDTKGHKGELEQSRAEIMTGYIKEQHPRLYYEKYLQILRGTNKKDLMPKKEETTGNPVKENFCTKLFKSKKDKEI